MSEDLEIDLSSNEELSIMTLNKLSGDRDEEEFFRSAANFYAWYLNSVVRDGAVLLISRKEDQSSDPIKAKKLNLLTPADLQEEAEALRVVREAKKERAKDARLRVKAENKKNKPNPPGSYKKFRESKGDDTT